MSRPAHVRILGFNWHLLMIFNAVRGNLEDINCSGCGVYDPVVSRIVNGKQPSTTQIPWMVRLQIIYRWNATVMMIVTCGGSIISPTYILTAAHCIHHMGATPVFATAYYNSTDVDKGHGVWVDDILPHEKFNWETLSHDIGVLRIEKPLQFDKHVSSVCLPTENVDLAGKQAIVAGWGQTTEDGNSSHTLQYAVAKILPFEECEAGFVLPGMKEVFTERNILCTEEKGAGACKGDSGGPLTVVSRNGRSFQAGIVSFGKGCARTNSPGMYTRVDKYVPWIRRQMRRAKRFRWSVPTVMDKITEYINEKGLGHGLMGVKKTISGSQRHISL